MKFLRTSFMKHNSAAVVVSITLLLVTVFLSVGLGAVRLNPMDVFNGLIEGNASITGRILYHVRLPRTLAAVLAGAAFAVAGAVIQEVLANPLASPGIIGVNAGAGFGVALYCAFFPFAALLPLVSFFGALLTVMLVYGIARKAGASRMTLLLSGVAVSSLMTAGINTITILVPDALSGIHAFQLGGLSGVSFSRLFPAGYYILAALILLSFMGRELDILALGDDTAKSLGLNIKKYRFLFLMLVAMLSGAAVSFGGLIGFVGLIVPHMVRFMIGGGNSRALMIFSALIGGSFLALCDTLARTAFSPFELPVGVLIAFIGVPFFLWLLFRGKRGLHND